MTPNQTTQQKLCLIAEWVDEYNHFHSLPHRSRHPDEHLIGVEDIDAEVLRAAAEEIDRLRIALKHIEQGGDRQYATDALEFDPSRETA